MKVLSEQRDFHKTLKIKNYDYALYNLQREICSSDLLFA